MKNILNQLILNAMRKFLFLLLLVVGLVACSTAPPPELLVNDIDVKTIDIADNQQTFASIELDAALTPPRAVDAGNSLAKFVTKKQRRVSANNHLSQMWEVSGKYDDSVISHGGFTETNQLYASLTAAIQEDSKVSVEEDAGTKLPSGLESIIGIVMVILTTVFGGFFKKYLGKFKQAIDLLESFHDALEDGNLSKDEIAALKQKYYQLIGKGG